MQYSKSVALVGCGLWGRNVARVLAQLGALKVICDADANNVQPLSTELKVEFTTDLAAALQMPGIDAVAIATPAATHADVARQVLLAGKHVYIEKPIALSIADATEVAALAVERGRVLMVGHLLQYHPGFIKLLELVRQRALGKITYAYSNRLNQGRVRTEENAMWSLAPHDFSMILAVAGEAPSAVTASGAAIVQLGIPDLATVHLAFANGVKAHIFCSWLNPFKEHKLTVIGDQAMAVFDDTPKDWADKTLTLFSHKVVRKNDRPEFSKGNEQRIIFEHQEPLKNELAHFLECVATGAKPRTNADEAISVLDALERAQRAMENSPT